MNTKLRCLGAALVILMLAVSKPFGPGGPGMPEHWRGHSTKIIFPKPPPPPPTLIDTLTEPVADNLPSGR